jgi:hypothetical protein
LLCKKRAKFFVEKKMGEGGHKLQKRRLLKGLSSLRRSEETGGERGVIKSEKWGDVVYGWSLM